MSLDQHQLNKAEDTVDKGLIIVTGHQIYTQMLVYDITGYKLII